MVTAAQSKALMPVELKGLTPSQAMNFDQLMQFAQVCYASGVFEDVSDVAQAFIKIARGAELGIPPTSAMQGFDIIKKRLFVKPWLIAAKINASGYGGYVVEEQSPTRCTIAFRRRYPERGWVTLPLVTYTIEEARGHGLVQRSPHWQTSPANMLYQRCMGRGGAMYFPELLAGIEPPPEDVEPDPAQLRRHVTALFGEPLDPTAPSSRVPVEPPVEVRTSESLSPAGEASLPYLAQIEAAILANHGQIEPWYTWAERRFKHDRTQFTVMEWQEFLQAVRDAAGRQRQEGVSHAPGSTIPMAEVQTATPVPESSTNDPGEQDGPDLFAQMERDDARGEEYGNGGA